MATRRVSWNLRVSTEDQQVDRTGRKLDELMRKGEKLDKSTYAPKVDLDDDEFNQELADIRTDLERLEADVAEVKIDADDTEARSKIDRIIVQMRKLDQMTADPDIDVDGVILARSQLSDLQHKLNRLDRTRATPSVRIDGVSEMQKDASLLLDTIVALGPAAVVAGTTAAGGLTALAGSIATTGVGVGVLAGSLSGISDAVKAMNKMRLSRLAGDDPTASDLLALQRALAALPPEGRDFVRFVANELIPALEDLRSLAQQHLLPGLTDSLKDLDELLPQARNLVINYSDAWNELARDASDALTDPFWQQYFDFLGDKGADSMQRIVRATGNFVEGLAGIQQAFFPLQSDVENGILGWSRAFARWGRNLRFSDTFQEFLDYVERNGPRTIDLVESIADALLQIGEAASPVGEKLLPILTAITEFIGTVADSPLGTPLIAMAVGLSAINRASRVAQVTKTNALFQGITGFMTDIQSGDPVRRMNRFAGALRGVAGVAGLGLMVASTQTADSNLQTLMSTIGGAATGASIGASFGAPGAITGGVIGALSGLAFAFGQSGQAATDGIPPVESYIDTLDKLSSAATRATRASVAEQLQRAGVFDIFSKAGIPLDKVVDAVLSGGFQANKELTKTLLQAFQRGAISAEEYKKASDAVHEHTQALIDDKKANDQLVEAMRGQVKTLRDVSERTTKSKEDADNLTRAMAKLEDKTREHTGSAELNRKQLQKLGERFGLTGDEIQRLIRFYRDLTENTNRGGDASEHYDFVLGRLGKQLDLTRADSNQLTKAILDQEDANVRLKGKADLTEKQLRDVAHQMGLTKQQTQELIEKYNDVPKDIRTDAHFEDNKARHDVESFVRWTEQKWKKLKTVSPGFFGPDTIHVPGGQAATGGYIDGPGTKTSDSIHMRLSRGEFVQQASAVDREGIPAMAALNAGRATIVPRRAKGGPVGDALALDADYPWARVLSNFSSLRAMIKAMGSGSARVQAAIAWARKQVGDDYHWGSVGPDLWDCSGFMSGVANFLRGDPLHVRLGSTSSFPWPGFARGFDPGGFTIGSTPQYPGSSAGHMAGTLGGVNVESRGGEGVVVGPRARGWNDPGFTQHFHLTGIKKGGGRGAGGDIGALDPREKYIIRHEAGGLHNVNANNPISSAFGIGQLISANRIAAAGALGYPTRPEYGDTGTTNWNHQLNMMRWYIRDRYGTLEHAYNYHKAHGVYDQGGPVPHGTRAVNMSGLTEEMLTNQERQAFIALGKLAHVALVQGGTWGGGGSGSGFSGEISGTMVITNWEQGTAYFRGVANDNYNGRSRHAARMARMG